MCCSNDRNANRKIKSSLGDHSDPNFHRLLAVQFKWLLSMTSTPLLNTTRANCDMWGSPTKTKQVTTIHHRAVRACSHSKFKTRKSKVLKSYYTDTGHHKIRHLTKRCWLWCRSQPLSRSETRKKRILFNTERDYVDQFKRCLLHPPQIIKLGTSTFPKI